MRHRKLAGVVLALTAAVAPAFLGLARGQQVHRNGFESTTTTWVKGSADAAHREVAHTMSEQGVHDGQRCEYIQINADKGTYVYYQYPTQRAPITEELNISLWVRSNRPGVQLLARLVLPHERDPNNLDDRLTTLIRGEQCRVAGRWKQIELRNPVALAKQQQQLMQAKLRRPVDFSDAYIDTLVLNVYGGPGLNEVWIDDLEMGPVIDANPFQPTSRPSALVPAQPDTGAGAPRAPGRAAVVELNGDQLLVGGRRFFFRGIRHSDTPLKALRDAGFNTVWVDYSASPKLLKEAVDLGFWLVPALPGGDENPALVSSGGLGREVSRFPEGDAVLFWELGGALAFEQRSAIARSAQLVHNADPQHPIGADVWDGFSPYSRSLGLVGVHRWPLMTALGLPEYREWLNQRRLLGNPGTFTWTWIQTHLPDWYTSLVYDQPATTRTVGAKGKAGFDEPVGPQPEQIRLLTYLALSAGCRGLGFWSDRFLADSHQGRDRLLALALLNQELEMLEPLLVTVDDPPQWVPTSLPEVQAAVLRTPKGILVLPMWLGNGAQFVPGQSAVARLSLVVPGVPQGTQAWEVTPGDVRGIRPERVIGGTRIVISEFGLTTAVVFTADMSLVVRFQEQARSKRQLAAQWTHDLARQELEKVVRVEEQLERGQHTLPDGAQLLADARNRLKATEDLWENRLFAEAYREGQRALRPVRIMMRAQWEQATRGLDTPVASPYAVSFFTLPRHWQLMEEKGRAKVGPNVLPGGDFEKAPGQEQDAWTPQETTLDDVEFVAQRVASIPVEKPKPDPKKPTTPAQPDKVTPAAHKTEEKKPDPGPDPEKPKEGERCLMLQVKAKNPQQAPRALERTFLAINSPAVHLKPGTLVQVSGWVRIPKAITASVDGALLYDSAGGEPLAVRLTAATGWKKFTLYRRVPASGTINVTLALTGLGTVYFDDVRIEPLVKETEPAIQPTALRGN
jgi:hypothetical protein